MEGDVTDGTRWTYPETPGQPSAMAVESDVPSDEEAPGLYNWLVWLLGAIAILSIVGIVVLAVLDKPVDAGLAALGGIAVGALASPLNPRK